MKPRWEIRREPHVNCDTARPGEQVWVVYRDGEEVAHYYDQFIAINHTKWEAS